MGDCRSLLSFQDFARLCALPLQLMPRDVPPPSSLATLSSKALQATEHSGNSGVRSDASTRDSDSWSQCSTDDGYSDVPLGTPSGWQTPTSCDDLDDAWPAAEMKIVNTFIHFSTPSIATRTK